MTIQEIIDRPVVLDKVHESCYRSYHILEKVLEMIELDVPKETIKELVAFMREYKPDTKKT